MEANELECFVTVESLNSNDVVIKRRTYKSITVLLGRDEFCNIAYRASAANLRLIGKTFLLTEISIRKRFLQEGKATIKLTQKPEKLQIMFPSESARCFPEMLVFKTSCTALNAENLVEQPVAC